MIRLAAADLDGTIIDAQGICLPSVSEEVKRIRKMGIAFAICSGRPISSVIPLLEGWHLSGLCDYIIGCNGGEVLETSSGKRAVTYRLSAEVLHEIMDLYEPLGLIPTLYTEKILYVQKRTEETDIVAARLHIQAEQADIRSMTIEPEMKEMFVLKPELMAQTEAFYASHPDPRYIAFKTAKDLFEFNHPLLAKDVGLRVIASMMHITPDEIIAFGDTTNDIAMLKYVKYGICMGNGTEDAKKAAYDTAACVQDNGFSRYLQDHLKTMEFQETE